MSKVVVAGLGYVGLPLAVRAAEVGHEVIGLEVDPRKVEAIAGMNSYIEDVSDHRLKSVVEKGSLRAVTALSEPFDLAIITVPTPLGSEDEPDLSYVAAAARTISKYLTPGATVVLESTTYPGTTEGMLAWNLTDVSGLEPGIDFHLGFSPERIDPGPSEHTLENTPKLVSATTPAGLEIIQGFYDTIVETTVPCSSPRVAEMAKVFENTQAYVNIALVNELAGICHSLDIDVHEMIDAAMTKGHSVARWTPGPGVGGHCLPIDPLYLTWLTRNKLGRTFHMAETAHRVNASRPEYVAQRAYDLLVTRGIPMHGARILVMGLAYKPGVGDLRESPALPLIEQLGMRGARVTATDPLVEGWTRTPIISVEELPGALSDFDLVIVATDHDAFDYDKVASESQQVLDCRHVMLPSANVVAL